MRAMRIAVIGAGAWGLALADLLSSAGQDLIVWGYDASDVAELTNSRTVHSKFPEFRLQPQITVTADLGEAVAGAELLIMATPAQFSRSVITRFPALTVSVKGIVNVAKGIEVGTLLRMSQLIRTLLPTYAGPIATLSGPSHAEELVRQMPTAVVVASDDPQFATAMQQLFTSGPLRVYTSADLVGVEIGGSLKNCIAIATGITDGLGLGDNTRGALVTRGLAEITRLGVSLGASASTFYGLSGLGDLVTTCASVHSRNHTVGLRIGRGERLDAVLASMSMVAEGVETTRSAAQLAEKSEVDLPIIRQMVRVLFDGSSPAAAVADLMGRPLKAEASP